MTVYVSKARNPRRRWWELWKSKYVYVPRGANSWNPGPDLRGKVLTPHLTAPKTFTFGVTADERREWAVKQLEAEEKGVGDE